MSTPPSHPAYPAVRGAVAVGLTLFLAVARPANAGDYVLICDYSVGDLINGYVPDFDQLRDQGPLQYDGQNYFYDPPGLASGGNSAGGWNFCVPSCYSNWMAYIGNHGFPGAMPTGAPAGWQSQSQYDNATWTIGEMGILMNTNPVSGGTTTNNMHDGMLDWIDATVPGTFTHHSWASNGNLAPTLADLGYHGASGHLVVVHIGWYVEDTPDHWVRNGGHVTTLNGEFGFCDPTGGQIRFRDPASDFATYEYTTQSQFASETYDLAYVTAEFSTKGDLPYDFHTRTHARPVGYGNSYPLGAQVPFIDGYSWLEPQQGLTGGPNGELAVLNPIQVPPFNGPVVRTLDVPTSAPLDDCSRHLFADYFTVLPAGGGDPAIRRRDRISGETEIVHTGTNPSRLECGAAGQLYVLDGPSLLRIDFSEGGPIVASVTPPTPVSDFTYDAVGNIIAVADAGNVIYEYDADLVGGPVATHPLPAGIQLDVRPRITTSPADDSIWLTSEGGRFVWRLRRGPGGLIELDSFDDPKILGATALQVDRRNHVFVVSGGVVVEFEKDPSSGSWIESPVSDFAGLPAVGPFKLTRSGMGPGHRDTPHILPTQFAPPLADCAIDLDGDNLVDVTELLGVLAAWGPNPGHPADVDGNDVVDVGDLLAVLGLWGPCG